MTPNPPTQLRRLQRWVAAWAAPYCARMPEQLRADARKLDGWLRSRAGLGLALGLGCALAGTTGGLMADALRHAAVDATPILLALLLAVLVLVWGVAQIKRVQVQRELDGLRLEQEREASARQAAESQLHLLQAQIQPHFLFNTLAALQHWVDAGDPRAGPLLRDLTAFLRGSTALLAQPEVALADEAEAARQYLRILQTRLGARLAFSVEVAANCATRTLPSGILLTLVENAVEHGIAPALHGGRVQVQARCEADTLVLEVRDDGAGLAPQAGDGLGLANCRQRLQHRYGERASLNLLGLQPGACARVEVRVT